MDQPKIERLLRLMKMLTGNVSLTVEDLSDRLDMSVRTIYRYIDTFRNAGFIIKQKGKVYRIDKTSPYFNDISKLVHFTEEEAHILKSAIESIDETNVLKQNLKKKLYTVYDYRIMAETVTKGKNAVNVNRLVEAIEDEKQVILKEYSSVHSNKVRNRHVEPFEFTTNYIQIWAYDIESGSNKLFKVSRISEVEILEPPWKHSKLHRSGFIDIFRISSFEQYPVELMLGMRAAMLLMEEYPLAELDMIKRNNNRWLLKTTVCSYEGIARFILGLADDLIIIGPQELKDFVSNKLKKIKF